MNKGIAKLLSISLLCIFLIACQNTKQMDNNSSPPSSDHIKYNQEGDIRDDQPQLEGGSERDVREPHPVSNDKLQKEYPNILVLHGNPTKNQVALTFDDGPDIRFTPQVLDVLAKHDVKATFFLIGARAKAHRDITKRIHDEGHAIGNHTYWHPNLPKESLERLRWELTETEQVIEDIIGFKPRLFRSPYGALNEEIVKTLGEMNHTVIGWDVDSVDWKLPGADMVADNVLSNVGFGSIILMHDGGDWSMDLSGTVEGLDRIISKLKEDGTKFVTLPELIGIPETK
ncbi:polysaccharide deacetylase family protein [Sporosarcina sp. Marseille-Q4063]|uniref:polysaccharide deacetylase family protein n=1 Tax=Sporosarcina sp. Marseille-Q4063 TaxID=2810514 RepID=UPI001BAF86AC|nr:polysaccharide deacetylase family protein [Sporosarcina sp. Marseille-Q4063]QUW22558.1 polysaccharide deacetylase family protein [Sporosarcina sp. Marseille-Q4063]